MFNNDAPLGIMMTAVYTTMDGHAGLPGWRWVFIIDGVITLPIAIFGFLSFPDLPENTKAPYFSAEERALAISRLPPKNPDGHNIGFSLIKRVLFKMNLQVMLFPLLL
jgi:ACS family pantothenate transporter-like MFS transporter